MAETAEHYASFYINNVQWILREDAPGLLRDELLPRVSSQHFFESSVPAKAGESKSLWLTVLRINGEERLFIIKRYENKHPADRLKTLLCPSKAHRELEAARGVSRRGIPTPLPLAIGVRKRWGMITESFVILEKMKDCQDLNQFFLVTAAPGGPAGNAAQKRDIIKALGELARKANEAGVHQSDFALNNFLLARDHRGTVRLYLSDFEKITLRRSLSFNQEITCLAKLNRVGREVSLADRMRFLKTYAGADPRSPQLRALSRTIQEHTRKLLLRDYKRGRKTSVYTDVLYDRVSRGTVSGFIRKGYALDDILAVINRFDLLAGNLSLREINNRTEVAVELSCEGIPCRLSAVRYHGNPSAGDLWSKICTLALAGFPVSLPHIFLTSRARHDEEGYLFFRHREGEIPIGLFCLPSRGIQEIEETLDLLVILLRKLHRFGAFDDTLTESTFSVVERKGGKPSLFFKNADPFMLKEDVTLTEKKRNLILLNALLKQHYPSLEYDLVQRYFRRPGYDR